MPDSEVVGLRSTKKWASSTLQGWIDKSDAETKALGGVFPALGSTQQTVEHSAEAFHAKNQAFLKTSEGAYNQQSGSVVNLRSSQRYVFLTNGKRNSFKRGF